MIRIGHAIKRCQLPRLRIEGYSSQRKCLTRTLSISSGSSSTVSVNDLWDSGRGILNLLTNKQRDILVEQKKISKETLLLANRVGGVSLQHCATSPFLQEILTPLADSDKRAIADRAGSEDALDSTFSVVIAGEFNAGKSTLINALLGQKLLETGVLPTTDQITVLTSQGANDSVDDDDGIHDRLQSETIATTGHSNAIILHRIPNVPLLQDLTLIDTPGTNAVVNNHTQRTLKLLPSADLILFVTSADRPFPESEKQLLKSIQAYRKNIVVVINKMDVLDATGGDHGEVEKKKVANFVAENAADLLGARAIILPISAKDALTAKLIHGKEGESTKVWKRSNFSSLETFLMQTLTEETKIQAKLLNPLGVAQGMLSECTQVLKIRKKELETDTATVQLLKSQMNSWKRDMEGDMERFQTDAKHILEEEMHRCETFVNAIGLFECYALFLSSDDSKLNAKWDDTKSIIVSSDIKNELLLVNRECSDAIASSARAQGQAVIEYLGKRPAAVGQNLIGSVTAASRFEDTRKDLSDKMCLAVNSVLSSYDAEKERLSVFQSMKNAAYISVGSNTVMLSSGILTALELVDVIPGLVAAFVFASVGFGITPFTHGKVTEDYEFIWKQREVKLKSAYEIICSKEIKRIHMRILDGVAPYTRYVETEEDAINSLNKECDQLSNSTQILINRILRL